MEGDGGPCRPPQFSEENRAEVSEWRFFRGLFFYRHGRRKMRHKSTTGLFAAFLLVPASLGAGTIYDITDLGTLPGGAASTAAGISSNGRVTGSGDTAGTFSQPFLWTPIVGLAAVNVNSTFAFGTGVNASGTVVGYQFSDSFSSFSAFTNDGSGPALIPTLGGADNAATAINDAGTVVGYSETSGGAEQAFSFASDTVTPLGTLPGGTTSRANAINGLGVIVGQADASDGSLHAVTSGGGAWSDLGVPSGYGSSVASAVSDAGYIAGTLYDGLGGSMGFLWMPSNPVMIPLGALTPGGNSQARGVNSSGLVVGVSDGVPFLYDGTVIRNLNSMLATSSTDWLLTEATAINDLGQIAGTGYYNGLQHAFLLNPESSVPEPASLLLVCGGLLLAASSCRRSRKVRS
jgi:probable HAF family extracellular repeat protein